MTRHPRPALALDRLPRTARPSRRTRALHGLVLAFLAGFVVTYAAGLELVALGVLVRP